MGYGGRQTAHSRSITGATELFSTISLPPDQFMGGFTEPPVQWVLKVLSLEVKQQELEADHSHQCNAKVKNGRALSPFFLHS
jgi:hypothetical protein